MNDLKINLYNHSASKTPTQSQVEQWITACFSYLSITQPNPLPTGTITVVINHTDAMIQLNQQFRQIAKATNVLSFPADDHDEDDDEHEIGDIVLCIDTIIDEAKACQITTDEHLAHLTIHGVLHLLGYDHIDDHEAAIMETIESSILATLNIANPYDE